MQSYSDQTDTLYADIFRGTDILELSLMANFDSLLDDAAKLRTVSRAAFLKLNSVPGHDKFFPVQLETRGNFRMKPENCNFPPIKLIFEKSSYAQSVFLKNNSIKLVDQCQLFNPQLLA